MILYSTLKACGIMNIWTSSFEGMSTWEVIASKYFITHTSYTQMFNDVMKDRKIGSRVDLNIAKVIFSYIKYLAPPIPHYFLHVTRKESYPWFIWQNSNSFQKFYTFSTLIIIQNKCLIITEFIILKLYHTKLVINAWAATEIKYSWVGVSVTLSFLISLSSSQSSVLGERKDLCVGLRLSLSGHSDQRTRQALAVAFSEELYNIVAYISLLSTHSPLLLMILFS